MATESRIEWKWGALAALAMALLALYPQINIWMGRGSYWQGSYVLIQGDEDAYSAYINALIDGRPRRNDPHTGRDDAPGTPQPESLFSIQFIPAYVIALPARLFHLSTSTAFILLIFATSVAASLSIFWLIAQLTNDSRLAAVGVIFALCLGTLVATQGGVRAFLGSAPTYSFFPFLRRYQPSVAFPMLFVFFVFIWKALKSDSVRRAVLWAAGAGLVIAILVFSYFYLWTAAIAWLAGLACLWLVWQPDGRARILIIGAIVAVCAVAALGPYAILLSHRDPNMDKVQLLTYTHTPDLLRVPELIGLLALAALVFRLRRGIDAPGRGALLFAASLAALPLIVFNQQIITGRSMQPLHYELFIVNYVSLLAVVVAVGLMLDKGDETTGRIPGRALALTALVAFGWGVIESSGATKRDVTLARLRDDAMPVARRLRELSAHDGGLTHDPRNPRPVVFSSTLPLADCIPTSAPVASLWALHMDAFPGANFDERKERFYQYMYYSGISDKDLERAILEGRFAIMVALFGVERVIPGLVPDAKPLSRDEMRTAWLGYTQYIASFNRDRASRPGLSYIVVPTSEPPDLRNLDQWYERDAGEKAGLFTIYRVKLRP
jgi:hypothetical protein